MPSTAFLSTRSLQHLVRYWLHTGLQGQYHHQNLHHKYIWLFNIASMVLLFTKYAQDTGTLSAKYWPKSSKYKNDKHY